MEISNQTLMEGQNCIRMKKEPPVQKSRATRISKKELMMRFFCAASMVMNRNM